METLFFKTEAKSRKELRALAHSIRDCLGLKNETYFPITEVMEILHYFVKDSYYEIVPTTDLDKNVHAYTDIAEHKIVIREDVYDGACAWVGRDRMTLAHEFAHFLLLCFFGYKLFRSFGQKPLTYEDPEWQAKCLAGELMIDSRLITDMSIQKVEVNCGVSSDAVKFQLSKI